MKIELRARSSDGEPCLVTFSRKEGRLSLSCSCSQSRDRRGCQHRRSLLKGEKELLFDPGEAVLLTAALGWDTTKTTKAQLESLEAEIAKVQAQRKKLEAEQLRLESLLDALFEEP
ncbi:MAG: hypothetical protein V4726_10130 [Verrucomicrobiota bacterium]